MGAAEARTAWMHGAGTAHDRRADGRTRAADGRTARQAPADDPGAASGAGVKPARTLPPRPHVTAHAVVKPNQPRLPKLTKQPQRAKPRMKAVHPAAARRVTGMAGARRRHRRTPARTRAVVDPLGAHQPKWPLRRHRPGQRDHLHLPDRAFRHGALGGPARVRPRGVDAHVRRRRRGGRCGDEPLLRRSGPPRFRRCRTSCRLHGQGARRVVVQLHHLPHACLAGVRCPADRRSTPLTPSIAPVEWASRIRNVPRQDRAGRGVSSRQCTSAA